VAWYLDTSAAAKLVEREAESDALRAWLVEQRAVLAASDLLETELIRAARRLGTRQVDTARHVLATVDLVPLARRDLADAALVDPPGLRSLDALHLVCALRLRDELDGIVTYDDRLAGAATLHGLAVAAPGHAAR
jgi:uncharacterized protein